MSGKLPLTEAQIKGIQHAIKVAQSDMEDWNRRSMVTPEMMQTPINRFPVRHSQPKQEPIMNRIEIEEQIAQKEAELEALKAMLSKPSPIMERVPKGERYWGIHASGEVRYTREGHLKEDDKYYASGNYFLTEYDAQMEAMRRKSRIITWVPTVGDECWVVSSCWNYSLGQKVGCDFGAYLLDGRIKPTKEEAEAHRLKYRECRTHIPCLTLAERDAQNKERGL